MNESETRAEHIDPALAAAGWGVVAGSRIRREYAIAPGRLKGHGTRGKALAADYVLEYRNTKLAVIEAKAWDRPLTEGVGQAKDYAGKLAVRFAYATNGQGLYEIDMSPPVCQSGQSCHPSPPEREVSAWPTPDELWARTFPSARSGTGDAADKASELAELWRDRFATVPFEDKGGSHPSRYYQDIAGGRVLEAIGEGRTRILLTLATGTGKTFIAFQIAWKLFYSRWNLGDWKAGGEPRAARILFLADRNILADQAYNAFSAFPEDAMVRIAPDDIRKKGKVPTNGSLFFTIFQTFMTGPVDGEGNPSPYFGEPVFVYSLREGINDGFLTPFRVKQIATTLDYYIYTPDDTVVEGEIEAGKVYEEADFNRNLEIREREKKRVEIFVGEIDQREKTLVFCANQAKLTPPLQFKYRDSLADAVTDLGKPADIARLFASFQKYLYQEQAAA